jgi:hypothetical protein
VRDCFLSSRREEVITNKGKIMEKGLESGSRELWARKRYAMRAMLVIGVLCAGLFSLSVLGQSNAAGVGAIGLLALVVALGGYTLVAWAVLHESERPAKVIGWFARVIEGLLLVWGALGVMGKLG